MAEVLNTPENKLAQGQHERLRRVAYEGWAIGAKFVPDAVYVRNHAFWCMPKTWDIAWLKKEAKKRKLWRK